MIDGLDTRTVTIGSCGLRAGERFAWSYDFTAGWVIDLRVEAVTVDTYDPIGRTLTATGTGTTSYYQYAGGYLITTINQYKYGTRYYDPNNSGTWTQPDPSGQDPNPFVYVSGNPTNNTDPSGYFPWGKALASAGLVLGVTAAVIGTVATAGTAPAVAGLAIGAAGVAAGAVGTGLTTHSVGKGLAAGAFGVLAGGVAGAFGEGVQPLPAALPVRSAQSSDCFIPEIQSHHV